MTSLRIRELYMQRLGVMARYCMGISMLTILLPAIGHAEALTEQQSLDLGLNQVDFVNLLQSRQANAQGQLLSNTTWANPEFKYSREELGDETETTYSLNQRLEISGSRGLRHDAAQANIDSTASGIAGERATRRATIREHFFNTLYYQKQQRVFTHWVDKFNKVEATMLKRERAGDVSGYDRRRISREKVSLLSEQRSNQASYQNSWQKLIGIIGVDKTNDFVDVSGELLPAALPPLAPLLQDLPKHPSLMQLQHQAESARLSARAAGRSSIPDITIGIGQKQVEGPLIDESGLVLSASVPLPLFNRKQGEQLIAQSRARQTDSEYQLKLKRLQAELQGLWQQATQQADNARLFHDQSVHTSFELVRIAETAYRANEIGVLELVDAYRSALQAEQTALQLALDARMSRIELDKFTIGASQ